MAYVWRSGQLCGICSLKDFHLHMGSGDGTQISRFAQQVPLPTHLTKPGQEFSLHTSAKASQEEPHRAGLVTWAVSGTISLRQLHPSPQCQRDSQSGSCSVSKGLRVGNTSRKLPRGEAVMGTNRRR